LEKSHDRDIMRGATCEGAHTDDIEFSINNMSARHFGSQGQQRTAALSAKLAEIEIIQQATGEMPILLLDDVLSELDKHRQKFLLQHIQNLQTIVTCTGTEKFPKKSFLLKMENGEIRR
jgi:DNA replication and repair protein RecF